MDPHFTEQFCRLGGFVMQHGHGAQGFVTQMKPEESRRVPDLESLRFPPHSGTQNPLESAAPERRQVVREKVIGREQELARLVGFVADADKRALVLIGEAGAGKTTLWQAAVESAAQQGVRVLCARGAEAERRLPFATLADLLDDVHATARGLLAEPQRHALDVALVRADPDGTPPEPRAIALGVLNTLRTVSAEGPVLVAIDDVQWADEESVRALAFMGRRLAHEPVRLLLARRPGPPSPLESTLERGDAATLAVVGLSTGAISRLLVERLGLFLTRRMLRQVVDATLGNPLFALELGRRFVEHGPPAIGEELRLPDSLEGLLGARVANAPAAARQALLCVALGGTLPRAELEQVVGADATDAAVDGGLLVVDGDRARPSHPLLAAALLARASETDRRRLHRVLAESAADPVRRARHLASAASRPDARLAEQVAAGAGAAAARGATPQAVELAEHALRLMPCGAPGREAMVLGLAEYLLRANESRRLSDLLTGEMALLPPGATRARGHLLLASVVGDQAEYDHHLERAIAEATAAPELRALARAAQSLDATVSWIERLDEAETRALEARRLAPSGPGSVRARRALAWVRILRGQPIDDLRKAAGASADELSDVIDSVERVEGIRRAFRGEVEQARELFCELRRAGVELGSEHAHAALTQQLAELELRAGRCTTAAALIDELDPPEAETRTGTRAHVPRLHAILAAVRGRADEARAWADATADMAVGQRWDLLEVDRARGIAALAAGDPAGAVAPLLRVWEHTERQGVLDPGAFPVAPDLVEALAEAGDLARAEAVTERLAALAAGQGHPWGTASAERCQALVALTSGRGDGDAERRRLDEAARAYGQLGLGFDRARTLLSLGRYARRARKWAAAREALGQAAAAFDELGSDGWAAIARAEQERVGGRRPRAAAELTPTEVRVADLAAGGLSNKEIARTLVVSVHTVEAHLSRVYAKLGVGSRARLAAVIAGDARRQAKE